MNHVEKEINKLLELTNKEFYSLTLFFCSMILVLLITYIAFAYESDKEIESYNIESTND